MRVVVCASPAPGHVDEVELTLPEGALLGDALRAAAIDPAELRTGVWGKLRPLDHALREGDRVEVYRPLTVDPKEARRLRYRRDRQNAPSAPRR